MVSARRDAVLFRLLRNGETQAGFLVANGWFAASVSCFTK
jgi:hypothetical protein